RSHVTVNAPAAFRKPRHGMGTPVSAAGRYNRRCSKVICRVMPQPHVHSAAAHQRALIAFKQKQRAALMGAAVNLPLAIIKILVGYFGASQALIADGI